MPVAESYARGFAWTFFFNLLNKLLVPIAGIVLARVLGPSVMGLYAILQTLLMFSEVFRDSGISIAFLNEQELTDARKRSYQRSALWTGLALGGAVAASGWVVADAFDAPGLAPGMAWTGLAVFLNMLSAIPAASLMRDGRFRDAGLYDTVATFCAYGLTLVLLWAGHGFLGLILNAAVRGVILLVLTYRAAPVGFGSGEAGFGRAIARKTGSLVGLNILATVYLLADQFVATRLFGTHTGGQLGMAKWLTSRPGEFVANPLVRTLQVAFGNRAADREQLRRTFHKGNVAFLLVVAPIHAAIAVLAGPLTLALLGEQYREAVRLVPIMALYSAVRVYGPIPSVALVSMGLTRVPLLSWVVGYAIFVPWIAASAASADLLGLLVLFTTGLAVVNALTLGAAWRLLWPDRRLAGAMGRAALVGAATVAACWLGGIAFANDWAQLVAGAALGGATFLLAFGTMFAGGPLAWRSRERVKAVWREL